MATRSRKTLIPANGTSGLPQRRYGRVQGECGFHLWRPIENTYDLYERIKAPKKLVVYEGGKHSMGAASSVQLGENFGALTAEWVSDRLNGVAPEPDANLLIDMYGRSNPR